MDLLRENSKNIALTLCWIWGTVVCFHGRRILKLRSFFPCVFISFAVTLISVFATMIFAYIEGLAGGIRVAFGATYLYGIYFISPLILWILSKVTLRNYAEVMDLYAVYAVPCLFLLRCNCLIAGCCMGRQISGSTLHWPTREIELVFYAIVFMLLIKRKDHCVEGTQFPLLMALYGPFRFVIEWFRVSDYETWLHPAHIWSVIAAFGGFALYTELNKTRVSRGKKNA